MARLFSAAIIFGLAPLAPGQAFGRFGYESRADAIGLTIEATSFRVNHPTADRFQFENPRAVWTPTGVSDVEATISLGQRFGAPSKVRVSLLGPGLSLYFDQGILLSLSSTAAPYLSYLEGSVGPNVPTPNLSWVVVSFQDPQPPVLLGFVGGKASLQVSGRPGSWRISSPGWQGWMRAFAPLGNTPFATNSAASLGRLVERCSSVTHFSSRLPPRLTALQISADHLGVYGHWTFDTPGALVPSAISLAGLGGYRLRIDSTLKRLDMPTAEGPTDILSGRDLKIRFPARRIPSGRALALGRIDWNPPVSAAPLDVPSVVELALANLVSIRDESTRQAAGATVREYLNQAMPVLEPWSGQRHPFSELGVGLDQTAAQALLFQTLASTTMPSSEANALLTSLTWRRDWGTWTFRSKDPSTGRRAAAIAAVASCLCAEDARRLEGAMLQAGLAAERGRAIWLARRANSPIHAQLETLPGIRSVLFGPDSFLTSEARFAQALLSPVRIYGPTAAHLASADRRLVLTWDADSVTDTIIPLVSSYPLSLAAKLNLASCAFQDTFGFGELRVRAEVTGRCEAWLDLPAWAKPLPPAEPLPRFVESLR